MATKVRDLTPPLLNVLQVPIRRLPRRLAGWAHGRRRAHPARHVVQRAGRPPTYLWAFRRPHADVFLQFLWYRTARVLLPLTTHRGTSRELSVGPAAMVSLTIPSAIEALAGNHSSEFHQEQYAALSSANPSLLNDLSHSPVGLAFVTGLVVLFAAAFNAGYHLEQLLSATVLSGFTQGAAFLICVSQTKHLLAISTDPRNRTNPRLGIPPDADNAQAVLIGLWQKRDSFNHLALFIGVCSQLGHNTTHQ